MKQHYTYLLLALTCLIASTTKAQVNVNDSLALVDLYNSTNGPEWGNWLTGPVKDWDGIILTSNGKRVSEIYLDFANLTGYIPSSFGNLSNLGRLHLSNNQLSGPIPPELGNLSNLSIWDLSYNQLSGPIPPELGNLPNLEFLFLSNNQLSGPIPPELDNLSNLEVLSLSYNQLSGPIPPELGNLTNLEFLFLSYNQLSGSIPPELGNLSNLGGLHLSNNQLSGPIPAELGNLNLKYTLDLSINQLSGPIPPELSNLLNLKYLWLFNNQLTGPIPPELGNLSNLEELYLNNNKLSGNVPSSIANLKKLYSLDISHNRFTFNGIELIAQKFLSAKYNRQTPIPLHLNNNTLSVSAGGTLSNNTYVWYKKDKPGNTTIKGDSVFHPTESGVYFVKVRNKVVKSLNLVSKPIRYTAPLNAVASNKSSKLLNNSFSVYPNPAKNVLHVKINGNASFSLKSEDGKTLLTENIDKARTINISKIATGIYYLKNNNTNASQKILIIR